MVERWQSLPPYARRVLVRLACVPLLWLLGTAAVFALLRVGPERDYAEVLAGQGATEQQLEVLRRDLGLDDPLAVQYARWLSDVLRGDFGTEYISQKPIRGEIGRRLDPTAEIVATGLLISVTVSLGLSWIARRPWTYARETAGAVSALLAAFPFIVGLSALIIFPARWWGYTPPVGGFSSVFESPWDFAKLVLPYALLAGLVAAGFTAPAVSRAFASGSDARRQIWRALSVSVCASFPILLSLQVVLEQVLSIDGLGLYLVRATYVRDLEVVSAVFAVVLLASLIVWSFHPPLAGATNTRSQPSRQNGGSPFLLIPGLVLISFFLVTAWIGSFVTADPGAISATERFESPSWSHPFGTNTLGQDLLAQVVAACRSSLAFALGPVFIGLLPGLLIGSAVRRWSGTAAVLVEEGASAFKSLPLLPLTFVFVAVNFAAYRYEAAAMTMGAFAIGILLSAKTATLNLNKREDQQLCVRVAGAGACIVTASAILLDATLAYLRLGFVPGDHSFGSLIVEGSLYGGTYSRLFLVPGLCLMAIVLGFLLVRRALDDEVPPHLYER